MFQILVHGEPEETVVAYNEWNDIRKYVRDKYIEDGGYSPSDIQIKKIEHKEGE